MSDPSPAPDFTTLEFRAGVAAPPDAVWGAIGGFYDLHRFLDVTCVRLGGDGGIGSVRRINDAIVEPLVGRGPRSYTYAQTAGPMSGYAYHGCVACEADPDGAGSVIVYTLCYDPSAMAPAERAAVRARLEERFRGVVVAMQARAAALVGAGDGIGDGAGTATAAGIATPRGDAP